MYSYNIISHTYSCNDTTPVTRPRCVLLSSLGLGMTTENVFKSLLLQPGRRSLRCWCCTTACCPHLVAVADAKSVVDVQTSSSSSSDGALSSPRSRPPACSSLKGCVIVLCGRGQGRATLPARDHLFLTLFLLLLTGA
jgi:hypothetical protein